MGRPVCLLDLIYALFHYYVIEMQWVLARRATLARYCRQRTPPPSGLPRFSGGELREVLLRGADQRINQPAEMNAYHIIKIVSSEVIFSEFVN